MMKRSARKMKKKKNADSNDREPPFRNLRERKKKKVADASDSEESSESFQEEPKRSWPESNIREIEFERALYRWYEKYSDEKRKTETDIVVDVDELVKKAKNLVDVLGGSSQLSSTVTKAWIRRWRERYGVPGEEETASDDDGSEKGRKRICPEPVMQRWKKQGPKETEENQVSSSLEVEGDGVPSPADRNRQEEEASSGREPIAVECLSKVEMERAEDDFRGYTNDQIYFAFCFQLDWKSLPDRTVGSKNEDPVWLVMAANRSGRHRTRILVTGRRWRPRCLKNVNMLSQPVVYAGGGNGAVTPDLFGWWLRKEFMPAAESLNSESVLVAEEKWLTADKLNGTGNVRFFPVPRTDVDDFRDSIRAEFKTRYATLLLKSIANARGKCSADDVIDHVKEYSMKDAFPFFHKSWLAIRSESFQRLPDLNLIGERNREGRTTDFAGKNGFPKVEGEFGSVDLTLREPLPEMGETRKCQGRLGLTKATGNISSNRSREDRMLLLELQWLAHDVGLEVTDEDLSAWVFDPPPAENESIDADETESCDSETAVESSATASETVGHLKKALSWMETQPIDPNLLLIVRDVIDVAKQSSKMGLAPPHPGAGLPFFCHNGDHLTQPPPAHMGIPPYQLDAKGAGAMGEYWRGLGLGGLSIRPSASGPPGSPVPPHPAISPQDWKRLGPLLAASGLSRTPMYPFSAGSTYPYPMLSPEMSQVPASWHTPGMYPISAGAGFRSPYPTSLPISSTTLPSDFYRFSPTSLLPGHPGLSPHSHHSLSSHPAIVTPGPKQELGHHTQSADHNHRSSSLDHKNSSSSHHGRQDSKSQDPNSQNDKKKPHIKKPLNAFMLYMKEMRAKVVAECTLKESAAINQILGRRWHALGREEQAKYYELARRERQLHMQLYPDWSSRANSSRGKKRKRKQEANDGGNNMKKCRARYGLDQQSQWCKPCRRKKKCIRYLEGGEERDGNQSEDNLGSCGSVGEARTPPDDDDDGPESLPNSLSSPGGLSGLSSLTSPSMILPSPSTSLASPSVSLASPCMSLQSPLTPPTFDMKPIMPIALPPLNRNPVGTNPHDANNPLSVNQLTGKCIKTEPKEQSRPISVT